ncbi:MAG: hypothetical protein D6B27_11845 [Gammaproteobacteria bacterium]|nr:MAG: hypothetical protein D6B27_11845 [Gammaproteobacteria bacterium]
MNHSNKKDLKTVISGTRSSSSSIKEKIADFYNITLTQHEAKRLNGLNVRIERNDYRITKFFPFKPDTSVEETLKQAIECRNEHYKKAGFPPFLCRTPAQQATPCDNSETGWHGIRIRDKKDSRKGNRRVHISFTCPVPEFGKLTTKDISVNRFDGDIGKAIETAVSIKKENTEKYNKVVPVYNDLISKSIEAACLTEQRTLNPTLQYLKSNTERMWDQAYKIVLRNET